METSRFLKQEWQYQELLEPVIKLNLIKLEPNTTTLKRKMKPSEQKRTRRKRLNLMLEKFSYKPSICTLLNPPQIKTYPRMGFNSPSFINKFQFQRATSVQTVICMQIKRKISSGMFHTSTRSTASGHLQNMAIKPETRLMITDRQNTGTKYRLTIQNTRALCCRQSLLCPRLLAL